MSQKPIPEFAETELWVVRSTLKERYGRDIELQFADTEVQTGAAGMEWCPALFWSAKGANFAIIKIGAKALPAHLLLSPRDPARHRHRRLRPKSATP